MSTGSGGLTCQDRQAILDAHNKARQSVAQGRVSGQPGATKMLEMVWDEQLAQVAQRWADTCTIAHDKSRHVGECTLFISVYIEMSSKII